jgi:hypothetical protein
MAGLTAPVRPDGCTSHPTCCVSATLLPDTAATLARFGHDATRWLSAVRAVVIAGRPGMV